MLFLAAIPIGILIGLAFGGRPSRLVRLRLRWIGLLAASLVIQLLIFPSFTPEAIFPYATTALHLLSYALVCLWLAVNHRMGRTLLLGIGAICNLAVLAANGGYMPASIRALEAAGQTGTAQHLAEHGTYANIVLMSDTTRLNWLGDVLHLPSWMPLATAFSIGDVLIFAGLIWLIARGMKQDGRGTETP